MKLSKAIEIKQRYQYILQDASLPELIEADNLSIEAMNAYAQARKSGLPLPWALLPSETTE